MADRMAFPETMKEFIDNYSFKDSDEVYTNGSMLIQTFRVEQALEHYEQEIRNKAIDEFAEQIQAEISESIIWDMLVTMNKNGSISDTSDKIVDYVIDTSKKIAEQLKARSDEDVD